MVAILADRTHHLIRAGNRKKFRPEIGLPLSK